MDLQDKQITLKFSIQQLILYMHLLFNWVRLLWPSCVIGQAIIFCPVVSSIFHVSFSSPNLSRRRLDVYHTSTHGVALA